MSKVTESHVDTKMYTIQLSTNIIVGHHEQVCLLLYTMLTVSSFFCTINGTERKNNSLGSAMAENLSR